MASVLPAPVSVTTLPVVTFWLTPALATGAEFAAAAVVVVVVTGLFKAPSFTIRLAT